MHDRLHQHGPEGRIEQKEVLNMHPWNDERVTWCGWCFWEEGHAFGRLVDDGRFSLAAGDTAEVAV